MSGPRRSRLAAGAGAAVLLWLTSGAGAGAGAGSEAAAGAPVTRPASVKVTTSGNRSERYLTLPIMSSAWQRPRVVMALKPRQIPALGVGDRLRTSAELQLTNNCIRSERRCVGPPYSFSPRIEARIELSAGGEPPIVLARGRERCGQDEPHREHHCVLVIRPTESRLKRAERICGAGRCRLELIASAHHGGADNGDRIMLGGNRPDGSIPQDRGRLNLIRIPAGAKPRGGRRVTKALRTGSAATDLRRRSVLSLPLRHLSRGDGLEVSAAIRTSISHLPFSVRTTAHLILASSPGAVEPDRRARRVGFLGGEIDESNGFNCALPQGGCTTRKVGVMKIRRDPHRAMYANLVLMVGPKRAEARGGDAARLRSGKLAVIHYPALSHSKPRPAPSSTTTGRAGEAPEASIRVQRSPSSGAGPLHP